MEAVEQPERTQNARGAWRASTSPITRVLWERMLEAYRERPTLAHVQKTCKVGAKLARRALKDGFPHLNLPPFAEATAVDPLEVHRVMRRRRLELEATSDAQGEATARAAEDALAARYAKRLSLRVAEAAIAFGDKVLDLIAEGKLSAGEAEKITPRILATLGRLADTATAALERSMRMERQLAGSPDAVIGIQLLLDRCTPDELEYIERTRGLIPARILGHAEATASSPVLPAGVPPEAVDGEG